MEERLSHLHSLLIEQKLDGIIISSVPNIIHLTGYAGFSLVEREAFLLITKRNFYLFTDARYSEAVRVDIPHVYLKEISAATPITDLLKEIVQEEALQRVGFEDDNLTVAEYVKFKNIFTTLSPLNLRTFRQIKNIDEIKKIQTACRLGDEAFLKIQAKIKPGMSELDVARELESIIRNQDASLSFPTIVAFGKNAAVPHHLTGKTKLQEKDLILLDFGVLYENYCSDMTRTIYLGEPTNEQRKAYETVRLAQLKAIESIEQQLKEIKEVSAAKADDTARSYIIEKGYPSIPHSLGHGIGIEVHEAPTLSPKSKDNLQDGMVFSIEPGIYLPGNFGIRIEDLFAIQENELIQLTQASKDLHVM